MTFITIAFWAITAVNFLFSSVYCQIEYDTLRLRGLVDEIMERYPLLYDVDQEVRNLKSTEKARRAPEAFVSFSVMADCTWNKRESSVLTLHKPKTTIVESIIADLEHVVHRCIGDKVKIEGVKQAFFPSSNEGVGPCLPSNTLEECKIMDHTPAVLRITKIPPLSFMGIVVCFENHNQLKVGSFEDIPTTATVASIIAKLQPMIPGCLSGRSKEGGLTQTFHASSVWSNDGTLTYGPVCSPSETLRGCKIQTGNIVALRITGAEATNTKPIQKPEPAPELYFLAIVMCFGTYNADMSMHHSFRDVLPTTTAATILAELQPPVKRCVGGRSGFTQTLYVNSDWSSGQLKYGEVCLPSKTLEDCHMKEENMVVLRIQ